MPDTGQIRTMWDAMADDFVKFAERDTTLLGRQLLHALCVHESTQMLEVGGGAGALALAALETLRPDARLVVTDLSPKMVAIARARLPERVEVLEADAEVLPFPDGAFDTLCANMNLMIVADPDRALREAFRVLQPGGRAGWTVWGNPDNSPMMTLPVATAASAGVEIPPPERSNFHLADREALIARVRAAGFERVVVYDVPVAQAYWDGETFARETMEGSPRFRQLTATLPADRAADWRRKLALAAEATWESTRPLMLETRVVLARRPR